MKTFNCINCNKPNAYKYCNHTCQLAYQRKEYINEWLLGNKDGVRGPGQTSLHIKRYLLEEQNNKCACCGISEWNSKPIVLELEHKDGDSNNNRPENLEMICPNCHSQTATYKGANRGKGRHSRRERYSEGKSF